MNQRNNYKQASSENNYEDEEVEIENNEKASPSDGPLTINPNKNRFPFSIVWTPLPLLTWIIPVIGHTGICTSDGVIHDFAGSYFISVDNFAFGKPHKYVMLRLDDPTIDKNTWDKAIRQADEKYSQEMHNLCFNNCHSHVASALNFMKYKGKSNWNMFDIWLLCLTKSKYVSLGLAFMTYIGTIIILLLILIFKIQEVQIFGITKYSYQYLRLIIFGYNMHYIDMVFYYLFLIKDKKLHRIKYRHQKNQIILNIGQL